MKFHWHCSLNGYVEVDDTSRDSPKSIQDLVQKSIDLTPNGMDGFFVMEFAINVQGPDRANTGQGVMDRHDYPGSSPEHPHYVANVPVPPPDATENLR